MSPGQAVLPRDSESIPRDDAVRPPSVAVDTPEERGLARDEVRLLFSSESGHQHLDFRQLPHLLRAGDVLVVNDSPTLPAALSGRTEVGEEILVHLCTRFGDRLWLVEPRVSAQVPGPPAVATGERVEFGGLGVRLLGPYPGISRLRFAEFDSDPLTHLERLGQPIRYGHMRTAPDLAAYQTIFAPVRRSPLPGSSEMPSAARPFSTRLLQQLERRGVGILTITLHAGVSSLESADIEGNVLYPEPFRVSESSARELGRARDEGRRTVAVGTTVVRALASVWDGGSFRAGHGMTSVRLGPGTQAPPLDGLLTGFHESGATHLSLLEAVAGGDLIRSAYSEALQGGYLWHEFGDLHLLLP